MRLQRSFTEHPASVGETYFEHLLRAAWFGGRMLLAGGACLVHAVFPFLFVKTGSETITELNAAILAKSPVGSKEVDLAARRRLRGVK
jgi:Family of unknown function (DUF6356)